MTGLNAHIVHLYPRWVLCMGNGAFICISCQPLGLFALFLLQWSLSHYKDFDVMTNHGTSLSMDCKYELYVAWKRSAVRVRQVPPKKVYIMSPPSPREKEATSQECTEEMVLRQVWEKSEFVTRGPSKLAKPPNNRKNRCSHYKTQGKSHDLSMPLT
jgi:hypothetical protein